MAQKILIVDDEKDMLTLLKRIITTDTLHTVETRHDPRDALEAFREGAFDLVISDLKMPAMDGLTLLQEVKRHRPETAVIIMTAYGTIETAVTSIQKGAFDFITKPFKRERVLVTIDKALEWQKVLDENKALRSALAESKGFADMIGTTPTMLEIFDRIKLVATTVATVLITGPSGTGKELIARALHRYSSRSNREMLTVNCTAIPENVLESELFGHVKGAFTGAWKDKKGIVERAHKGTLFLDEIADLKPELQTKLLRLLQEGEYKPVGSESTCKADIRFVAATNHDLKADIKEKRFREDLYYRLNVITFELPALKERKDDIPALGFHFLKKYAAINQKMVTDISPSAMQVLTQYDYPGNVRELENIIERGVILCRSNILSVKDLSIDSSPFTCFDGGEEDLFQLSFREAKDKMNHLFHRYYIRELLKRNNGNISHAASAAGIQRQYLHRLMKEEDIHAEPFKDKS
ncbi:MAG: sigma-54 dependent transcriptional regulator [Deltaproteobacteria bacterium]|nr:sigma-54 dependent transcriptional regulator [Deltaproteobacteria bacterium]